MYDLFIDYKRGIKPKPGKTRVRELSMVGKTLICPGTTILIGNYLQASTRMFM
jgi:hypothetical protein